MKDTNIEKDFLDDLYEQTKSQKSPTHLDQHVLNEARAYTESAKRSSLFQWQRIASVAAVMVFSFYIFFDVQTQRESELSIDSLVLPQTDQLSLPAADADMSMEMEESYEDSMSSQPEPAEMTSRTKELAPEPMMSVEPVQTQSPEIKRASKAKAKPQLKKSEGQFSSTLEGDTLEERVAEERVVEESIVEDSIVEELIVEENSEVGSISGESRLAPEEHSSQIIEFDSAAPIVLSPEAALIKIRALLMNGDLESARVLFHKLVQEYPDFSIPADITEALDAPAK